MTDSSIRAAAQRLLNRWPPRVRIEDHAEVRRSADGVVFVDAVLELRLEEIKEPLCVCHLGSVCGEACRKGEHHDGCSWKGWRSLPVAQADGGPEADPGVSSGGEG